METIYQSLFESRWPGIKKGLLASPKKIIFCPSTDMSEIELESEYDILNTLGKSEFSYCWNYDENPEILMLRSGSSGKLMFYALDPASIAVADALQVEPQHIVLDLCAAPGGKALRFAQQLGGRGKFVVNEPSRERRTRLKKNLRQYLTEQLLDPVSVAGKDGIRFGLLSPDSFDRVLVDSPCLGDRHKMKAKDPCWSEKESKKLAKKQYALLCSAILALKCGGQLIYSTCSLSPFENDAVVERLIKKKSHLFEVDFIESKTSIFCEKTKYGVVEIPDKSNIGPMYMCRLVRK